MIESTEKPEPDRPAGKSKGHRRRFFAGMLTGGLLGGLLVGSMSVWSQAGGPDGWHAGGWCRGRGMSAADQRERIEFATDWMLRKVDASAEQRERIKAVIEAALQDLAPLRAQHEQNRDAMRAALSAPQVDRAALDALRRSELQLADQASARLVTAVAEAGDVLTPVQRAKLVELLPPFSR